MGDALEVESARFLNLEMDCEIELRRDVGRVDVKLDEGARVLIRALMVVLEDL